MNNLLVALAACVIASSVVAQTSPPSLSPAERQQQLQSAQRAAENSGNAQATAAEQAKNVRASKNATKLSKEEKAQLARDATRLNVNPENSSGSAATAAMQKQTTAQSKAVSKQNTEFRSKEGKQQLDSDLQKRSTP
jgi:hypothetical protein